jgi:hypothetical protein
MEELRRKKRAEREAREKQEVRLNIERKGEAGADGRAQEEEESRGRPERSSR